MVLVLVITALVRG